MRRRFLNKKSNSIHISYESQYFTIEALEDGLTAKLSLNACEYRIDDSSWYTLSTGSNTPSINTGQKIAFKITNPILLYNRGLGTFTISKKCNLKGNIMSMLYGDDFIGENNLSGKDYVFYKLFYNCTTIVDVSELLLPATTLAEDCYRDMFFGCRSLVTAPALPATTLSFGCYHNMFYYCTSLTTAPELPATTLTPYCYYGMFYGCTLLEIAPKLPATTLAESCYTNIFEGCTSLTTAPELPATTLTKCCYQYMFKGCTSLTTAPELPATTLTIRCYYGMFHNCTSLNYIKMLATNIVTNANANGLYQWVSNVANNGTFIKHPNMNLLPTGENGIPEGWTVEDYVEDTSNL